MNIEALMEYGAGDPAIRAAAVPVYLELMRTAFNAQVRKPQIRPSDFGSCRLELWAGIQGRLSIERAPLDNQLLRLDVGTMMGAWCGALLQVTVSALNQDPRSEAYGWEAFLEYDLEPGHIDALLIEMEGSEAIPVEFKSVYDRVVQNPVIEERSHCLQVTKYGNELRKPPRVLAANTASLVYLCFPGKTGQRFKQFDLDVALWADAVAQEEARLAPALEADAPSPDPQQPWSCYTCRYADCAQNKNKRARVPALLTEADFV